MPGIRLPPTPKTGGVGSGLDDIAPITPPEPIPATGTGSGGGARDGVGEGVDPPSSQPGSSSGSGPESGSVPGESEPGSGNGNADKDKNKGDEELPEIPDPGSDDASPTTTVIMPAPSPDATVPVRLGTGTAQPDDATTSTASPTASPSSTAESTAESAAGSGLLPVWAIVLIVIGAVVFLVFVVSLVVFCIRERQKKHERGKTTSYGRAVRRALAAATGAFVPIWIAKRLRDARRSKRGGGGAGDDAHVKFDKLLRSEMDQQDYYSRETLGYDPGASAATVDVMGGAPATRPAPPRRSPSLVSALSSASTLGGGGGRGRYERVGAGQPHEHDADAAAAAAATGLRRNASLVSALSSSTHGDRPDTRDIPPPTPISEHTPAFTASGQQQQQQQQRRPDSWESGDGVAQRNGAR